MIPTGERRMCPNGQSSQESDVYAHMPLDEDILRAAYGRHPARALSFDELDAGLRAEVAAGNVMPIRDGDLELFVYTNGCVYDRRWNLFSLISRGLILDTARREVVATPFPKFFNYGEAGV